MNLRTVTDDPKQELFDRFQGLDKVIEPDDLEEYNRNEALDYSEDYDDEDDEDDENAED